MTELDGSKKSVAAMASEKAKESRRRLRRDGWSAIPQTEMTASVCKNIEKVYVYSL